MGTSGESPAQQPGGKLGTVRDDGLNRYPRFDVASNFVVASEPPTVAKNVPRLVQEGCLSHPPEPGANDGVCLSARFNLIGAALNQGTERLCPRVKLGASRRLVCTD